MPLTKPISTADRLLSFRERLAKYYAAVRKGKVGVKPTTETFEGSSLSMAFAIEEEEQVKHLSALAADESFKKLGYKKI